MSEAKKPQQLLLQEGDRLFIVVVEGGEGSKILQDKSGDFLIEKIDHEGRGGTYIVVSKPKPKIPADE